MDEAMDEIMMDRESRQKSARGRIAPKKAKASYGVLEYIAVSFLVTHAFSSFFFESHISGVPLEIYRILLYAACIGSWLWFSLRSGIQGKWGFLIYAGVFWILPQIAAWLAESGPEAFRFSLTMYLLSEFALYYSSTPLLRLLGWATENTMICAVIAFAVCGAVYACGVMLKRGRRWR